MSDTVTIRRRSGAPKTHHVAGGNLEFSAIGDGPFTIPRETWEALAFVAGDSFEITDGADPETSPRKRAAKE